MKKKTISKIQDELWDIIKIIIRKKYNLGNDTWKCYTCDRIITSKSDAHTAHFIPDSISGAYLRYDFRNLRICCMRCNVHLGGNGSEYYRRMVEEMGQEHVDQIFRDKQKIVKAYDHYLMLCEEYKSMLE